MRRVWLWRGMILISENAGGFGVSGISSFPRKNGRRRAVHGIEWAREALRNDRPLNPQDKTCRSNMRFFIFSHAEASEKKR